MNFKIILSVYNVDNKHLSPSEKHVLVRLAIYGDKIYPTYDHLSKQTGFNRRALIRIVGSLVKKGFLHKKKRRAGKSNYYAISLERLKSCQDEEGDSDFKSPDSDLESPSLVTDGHQPSGTESPKSNLKGREKVKTHSKGELGTSVDSVCGFPPSSQNEFQTNETSYQALWNLWPKKEGRQAAQKIYARIVPTEISSEVLLEAAKSKVESLEATYLNESDRIRYCPKLSNWLRDKEYLDQPYIAKHTPSIQLSPHELRRIADRKRGEETVRRLMRQ